MAINYQKKLDTLLGGLGGERPSLLLHTCCGPCGSYVLEYLSEYFGLSVFFYNPNIQPEAEYEKRLSAVRRLMDSMPGAAGELISPGWRGGDFDEAVRGLEGEPEGGKRCEACFRLRLTKTARAAREGSFEYFCTTLTVSPHKDASRVNAIGEALAEEYGVRWLPSDFKKRGGFKRSIELSGELGLYRQDYCGCAFSRR